MRILYLTQYFNLPDQAGASRHYQFARAWTEAGHEVELLTGNVNYKTGASIPCDFGRTYSLEDHPEGFRIRRLWCFSRFRGSFRKRLLFFGTFAANAGAVGTFVRKPDIVFASSTPLTVGVPGAYLARRFRVPFVFELRDLWPEAAVAAGVMRSAAWEARTRRLAADLYRRADHLVAVTEGIRDGILSYGVPPEKVTLVPNGVDHWMVPESFRDHNPLAQFAGRFVCLYVGAHGIWNDLGTLVDAAAAMRDDPSVAFVFVGDGDHRPVLERRAREEKLSNVHFLGALPKQDAFAAICHADVGLIAASAHEHNRQTLPNKIFDYMAAAVPVVVAAGEGEMAELLRLSGGGFLTPAGDGPALAREIQRLRSLPAREREETGAR
ncbi:MAG: glycosyltransferase family 4 protein, partial [Candidatus Eisenbacteria bacterium]|nr:glycosyltransferase family 4 protein [Candidatus Eisenbacteria bacterium]